MTLDELLQIIRDSSQYDWETFSSPTFMSNITMDNEERLYADYHTSRASYKPDISIGMAWGTDCTKDFHEEWANRHPDPQASSHYLDIYYNGMLAYRTIYVVVDGGRSYMPLPKRNINNAGETVGWYISHQENQFFVAFNSVIGFDTQYSSYLNRCRIEIR